LGATKETRTEFYKNGHDKMGKELKGFIEETISESIAEREMDSWIATGKYLDLEDITKKFEGKQEQLKSVLKNTKTHWCKVRSTWLYADPEFVSQKTSSTEQSKDSKRQISSERKAKAQKVAKTNPEEGQAEDLSAAQIKALTKEAKALSLTEKNVQELMDKCNKEDIAPLIAEPLFAKLKLSVTQLASQKQEVELTLEHKKGDVAALTRDIKEAKSEALAILKVMRAQLVVANSGIFAPAALKVESKDTAAT